LFSATKTKSIILSKTGIVAYTENVRADLADSYKQAVSPLSIPKPGIIMG
jgi:hypothetical protein